MKKIFNCGHRGFGRFYHLCRQLNKGELVKVNDKFMKPKQKPKETEQRKLTGEILYS